MTVYLICLVILEVLFMNITIMYAVLSGKQYFPIVPQTVLLLKAQSHFHILLYLLVSLVAY